MVLTPVKGEGEERELGRGASELRGSPRTSQPGRKEQRRHQRRPAPGLPAVLCPWLGAARGQRGLSATLSGLCLSSQLSALCPESALLKEALSAALPWVPRVGREKFRVNNKRQTIEHGRGIGPSSRRSRKARAAAAGHSRATPTP